MCIILNPVDQVKKTKLFVLPNMDKTRQMTIYSNVVASQNQNMMILPVPNGEDLELLPFRYKNLFVDLDYSVRKPRGFGMVSDEMLTFSRAATLEIIDHGSYRVSIAPKLQDLLRLDQSVFPMTESLYTFFQKHYTSEFSYLCCVLKPGLQEYEPLCYSHPMHSSGRLFVPTLHYHVHPYGRIDTTSADWDHLIYSADTTTNANLGHASKNENSVLWEYFPPEFQKRKDCPIRCAGLTGYHANRDLTFEVY